MKSKIAIILIILLAGFLNYALSAPLVQDTWIPKKELKGITQEATPTFPDHGLLWLKPSTGEIKAYNATTKAWTAYGGVGSGGTGDLTAFYQYTSAHRALVTDPRFIDSRTPLPHNQATSTITGLNTALSTASSHIGNSSNPHSTTASQTGAEPHAGAPDTDDYVWSSKQTGVRGWVPQTPAETPVSILQKIATPLESGILIRQPGATSSIVPLLQINDCTGVWTYQVTSDGCVTISGSPRFYSATSFTPFANKTTANRSTTITARFAGPVLMSYTSSFRVYSTASYKGPLPRSIFATTTSVTVIPTSTLSARHWYYVVISNLYNACNSALNYTWSFRTGN
jgi:hypothetical protein